MLECVVNISEGARPRLISAIAGAKTVVDVHSDPHHNRSVLTFVGDERDVWDAVTGVTRRAVSLLDLREHAGAHPRAGVVDVVPWVDMDDPWAPATARSIAIRESFATWAAEELGVPSFLYGPQNPLPDVRRSIREGAPPDVGPMEPHPTAGVISVGARGLLVAYNIWLRDATLDEAKAIAKSLRRPGVRALGLQVGDRVQVSCNLTDPSRIGPAEVYDLVVHDAKAAELVGLVPREVLDAIPSERWAELDLSPERTIRR